jgi:alkylation response protein AidB-like acyl-CoA dehydrogenase
MGDHSAKAGDWFAASHVGPDPRVWSLVGCTPSLRSLAPPSPTDVIHRLRAGLPAMQRRARELDQNGGFPTEDIAFLRSCGALQVFGHQDVAPHALFEALRLVGRGSLSVGRLFEGHVNGTRLVSWYGDRAQRLRLGEALQAGEVYGVWNTEKPPGVSVGKSRAESVLVGRKCFASGAGHIHHVIVTAALPDGRRQMVIANAHEPARADVSGWRVRGMRATQSGAYNLTGLPVNSVTRLGMPDDYEREPRFSGGAWRFTAVQLGGIERILALLRNHLAASSGKDDPLQRAHFAHALAAARSAYLWVREAATRAEAATADASDVAFVLMTRHVVEQAGLEAIEVAERSVGTRAFFDESPIDQACRDLALYLRQPAPDQALDRAAEAFIAQDCWRDDPLW